MRITESTKIDIIKAILGGESERPVAQKSNASKSTVHTTVTTLLDSIKEKTNDRELLQILGNLIAIAIMIRRGNLSLDDARIGLQVSSLAKTLGIDVSDLLPIVAALSLVSQSKDIKPEELLQSAATILKIEREQGISYADAPAKLGEYQDKIQKTAVELSARDKEIEIRNNKIRELPRKHRTTQRDLDRWKKIEGSLQKLGVDSDNLDETVNFLQNAVDSDNDVQVTISHLKDHDNLQSNNEKLRKDVKQLEITLSNGRLEKAELDAEILHQSPLRDELVRAKEQGMTFEFFKEVRDVVESTSTRHGISIADSQNKFIANLSEQYDSILGYSKTLDSLLSDIREATGKKEEIDAKTSRGKEALSALARLRSSGLSDAALMAIARIASKTNVSLEEFAESVEKYGNMEKTLANLQERIEGEERRKNGLERKNAHLEDSTKTLQDARRDYLQEFEKFKGLTKTFENALTSLPERALDSVNRLAVTAEQTGREIGRLEAFSTLTNFISRGEGELGMIAYSTITVLRRLSERLPSNPMLQMDIDRVAKGLEGVAAGG